LIVEQSRSVYSSLGDQFYTGYQPAESGRHTVETRPGGTSKTLLNQASENCRQTSEHFKALQIAIELSLAPNTLSERRFTDAEKTRVSCEEAISAGYKDLSTNRDIGRRDIAKE